MANEPPYKVNLCDPGVEPTDEEQEWLMGEVAADIRRVSERVRQKLARQIEEETKQMDKLRQQVIDAADTETLTGCRLFLEQIIPLFQVHAAILYGSRARGTHRQDSDADLAVILERTDRRRLDITLAMADLAFDVLLETGLHISPLPVWIDEWEHPETHPNPALIENIKKEGIRI